MTMQALSRHIKKYPLRVDKITLDGWKEPLFLREMDADAMASFLIINKAGQDESSFSVSRAIDIICLHMSDENGVISATGDNGLLATALKRLKFLEVTTLFSACMKVSGLSADEVETAEGN